MSIRLEVTNKSQPKIQSSLQLAESVVAESIYARNKAWRRVIASDGKESQRSAARKVARHGDFAYWNGLLGGKHRRGAGVENARCPRKQDR